MVCDKRSGNFQLLSEGNLIDYRKPKPETIFLIYCSDSIFFLHRMSLFKARDWWSTVVQAEGGGEEECDTGCLVIGNINNEDPPKDKIVVGGFSGSLRIFSPQVS